MIRVRFAPSPTGYLHLGNIRTALFNYLFARHGGGKFILRIEDTDKERSREEYFQSLMEDMKWMGMEWDEGPVVGGPMGPYRQAERLEIYQTYIDQLLKDGKAYYCYVTEEETEEMKKLAQAEKRQLHFDNRGRSFTSKEIEERKARGIKPTVRFKIENPQLMIHDLIRGDVAFNLDEMVGDFVIQRPDGMPTFHLAVCVDDCLMKITHVIRGEDHLSNTPKHVLLIKAMGFEPPQYGHLSLIHGPGGEPLSKRLSSVSVREFRKMGYLPHGLANYIALLGWSPGANREILNWQELIQEFDLARVIKSSSNYDPQKLDWVNGHHLRSLSDEKFTELAMNYLKTQGALKFDETLVKKFLPVFKDKIERFNQLPEGLEVLADDFSYENPALIQNQEAQEILKAAIDIIPTLEGSDETLYQNFVDAL
ncbi:MAG: glutamate--tRNA ligase, partial [Candidatus Omnitrophica bacterium]|nr:glutamate--tRNA ligase [Candidatus Omnitrophota bacterium]